MKFRFHTIDEQADILLNWGMRSSEGLSREELHRVIIQRLEFISPYRLIPYWNLYRQTREEEGKICMLDHFQSDTYWEDILLLYMFDRKLRNVIFDGCSRIEIALRTVIAQCWAELCRHGRPHLNLNYYKPAYIKKVGELTLSAQDKLWKLVESNFKRNKDAYIDEYEDIRSARSLSDLSIWSFMEFTTLGNLENLLSNGLKKKLVYKIAQKMGFERVDFFLSGISLLTRVRNACAHQTRVWNRYWLTAQSMPILRSIPEEFSELVREDRIGAALTFCQMVFNTIAPQSRWKERLRELLESDICPTPHIHKILGFHTREWQKSPLWMGEGC